MLKKRAIVRYIHIFGHENFFFDIHNFIHFIKLHKQKQKQ